MKKLLLLLSYIIIIILIILLASCPNPQNTHGNAHSEIVVDTIPVEKDAIVEIENKEPKLLDSIKIKELSPLFSLQKDEFDPKGLTWVQPKNRPLYANKNGIYCYFQKNDDGISNFRLRIQYYGEKWLFIEKYQFSIDGKAYEFVPLIVKRDHDGDVWEWCDEQIKYPDEIKLIKALANAKEAKIKFVGRQYYNIKPISKKQINTIKETLDFYTAMGGKL